MLISSKDHQQTMLGKASPSMDESVRTTSFDGQLHQSFRLQKREEVTPLSLRLTSQ